MSILKRKALNRIFLSTIICFIVLIVYTLTGKISDKKISYEPIINKEVIYTINIDNYVSKAEIYVDNKLDKVNKIKEALETMIEKNNKNILLPSYFNPILPQNTRIINIEETNNIIKLNFSKEFLNIQEDKENALIESLIYTITSFDDIYGIEIYVEENLLKYLPNSKTDLPVILTRNYGINKIFDITSTENITKVMLYFMSNYDNNYYYVPITKYVNSTKNKIDIIIEELNNSFVNPNLISFLDFKIDYKILNDIMVININKNKLQNYNTLFDPLIFSIFGNYDINKIEIYNNNEKIYEKACEKCINNFEKCFEKF